MLPTKFRFTWPSSFRGDSEDLKKSSNQKQELPVAAMSVNGSGQNKQSIWLILRRYHGLVSYLILSSQNSTLQ
jgi:hypothetical protein